MMTNKKFLLLTLIILVVSAWFGYEVGFGAAVTSSPWTGAGWNTDAPNDEALVGNTYKELYDLRRAIGIRMDKEHIACASSSAGGEHKQGSARAFYLATASIPALQPDGTALAATDNGMLWHDTTTNIFYILDDYSDPTVDGGWLPISHFFDDIAVNTNKFTVAHATGNTVVAGTLGVTGASTFTAGITCNGGVTLGAGDDLIGSATSDITINTNKFTVAGATGNTVVAGTLDVTGNIDPTTYETTNGGFLDEDDMASDAADKVASQQSIKAYVAAQDTDVIGASTLVDSGTDAFVQDHSYSAPTAGIVIAYGEAGGAGQLVRGYTDANADPTGTKIAEQASAANTQFACITFPVKKGDYWEIDSDLATSLVIRWIPFGTLSAPVDQD